MWKSSKPLVVFVVCIAAAIVIALALHPSVFDTPDDRYYYRPAFNNAKYIIAHLIEYQSHHGHLPYDARGTDFALYGLHRDFKELEASTFAVTLHPQPVPIWDEAEERIRNSQWSYLNEEGPSAFSNHRVLLESRRVEGAPRYVAFGSFNVFITSWDAPEFLLGDWVSEDQFGFPQETVFRDWSVTHFPSGQMISSQFGADGLRQTSHHQSDIHYTYRYLNRRLVTCAITKEGEAADITETVQCDELGRILSIEREPATGAKSGKAGRPKRQKENDIQDGEG